MLKETAAELHILEEEEIKTKGHFTDDLTDCSHMCAAA